VPGRHGRPGADRARHAGDTLTFASYFDGWGYVHLFANTAGMAELDTYAIDEAGNNLWGVEVFDDGGTEYVAASDRDKGLYIYKYTAPKP